MLLAPSPNPVSDALTYRVEVREPTDACVEILDVSGRLVAALLDRRLAAGRHTFTWEPNQDGGRLASGIYYLRLSAERQHCSRMFVLMRR